MNASVALMNQYSIIAARYPLPTTTNQTVSSPPEPQASGSSTSNNVNNATNSAKKPGDSKSTSNVSTKNTVDNVVNISSSSRIVISDNDKENVATIEDIGSETSEADTASELRRRRLQKFAEKLD